MKALVGWKHFLFKFISYFTLESGIAKFYFASEIQAQPFRLNITATSSKQKGTKKYKILPYNQSDGIISKRILENHASLFHVSFGL